ncbi:hypothetical protein [Streptomyces sp. NPDC018693]|uniref:hypothetical protein n=1 Tax=unclassified Streptomyces TaxID=2593676 RepID=UPI0037B3267A
MPEPVATPLVWAAAFTGALLVTAALAATRALTEPPHALLALCALAALLGLCARFTAAPGTALVCWLFHNGFATAPHGELAWQPGTDAWHLTALTTATVLGTTTTHLVNAHGAYRRVTPGGDA